MKVYCTGTIPDGNLAGKPCLKLLGEWEGDAFVMADKRAGQVIARAPVGRVCPRCGKIYTLESPPKQAKTV